jgi:hypothetical protein
VEIIGGRFRFVEVFEILRPIFPFPIMNTGIAELEPNSAL